MRNSFRTLYILPVLLITLMAACSAPEDSDSTNNNVAASTPQNGPQTTNVTTVPAAPELQPTATLPTAKMAETAVAQPGTGGAPKLVVPKTVIDFGKQSKEKSLERTIVLKNAGNAELKIDAVEPS